MSTNDTSWETWRLTAYPAELASDGNYARLVDVLTRPKFLRNKVTAGLIRELQADYEQAFLALATLDPPGDAVSPSMLAAKTWRAALEPWAEYVRANAHILARHPELFFQQALNEPDDGPVAARVLDYRTASKVTSPWLERVPRRGVRDGVARGLPGAARSLAVAPDGSLAVAGTDTGEVLTWRTGSAVWREVGCHRDGVVGVAILGDGRHGYSVSDDETLRVWDFVAGGFVTQERLGYRPRSLWVVGTRGHLVIGGDGGLLDLRAGRPPRSKKCWAAHDEPVVGLAGGRAGRRVVSLGWDNKLCVWDLGRPGKLVSAHPALPRPSALAVPELCDRAFLGCDDGRVGWLDLDTGQFDPHSGHRAPVTSVWCDRAGNSAASAADDGTLIEWRGGRTQLLRPRTLGVTAIAIAEQTGRFVSGGYDRSVQFWPGASDGPSADDLPWGDWGWAVTLAGDGTRAVTWGNAGAVVLWTRETGGWSAHWSVPSPSPVRAAATDFGGRVGVTGSQTGEITLWDLAQRRATPLSPPHRGAVTAVAVTPDGRFAATWARDGLLSTWDLRTGGRMNLLRGCSFAVTAATVTPDFSMAVAWATDNHAVRVWDLRKNELSAQAARGSPESRRLANSSGVGEVYAARADGEGLVVSGLFGGDILARTIGPFVAGATTLDGKVVAACEVLGVVTFFRLRS